MSSISVIIPVHNAERYLKACLESLARSEERPLECIVVDDGCTDDTPTVAGRCGATILHTGRRLGPANARNLAARAARGDVLLFLDADVCLHPDTLSLIAKRFEAEPDLGALFGSYDDSPAEPGFVSQFRNLLHCFVHQTSHAQASTFWAGCGAIRRQVFLEHQGFDDAYSVPCIEDIELGNRLVRAGVRVTLAPEIQAQHLKRWTFVRMVVTDVLHRGLPWTRLILASGRMPNDLNLRRSSRASVVLVMLACALAVWTAAQAISVPGNVWTGWEVLALAGLLAGASALNWRFTRFLAAKRGWRFAVAAVPLHWVYFACCGVSFGLGLAGHLTAKLAVRLGLRAAAAETGGLSG